MDKILVDGVNIFNPLEGRMDEIIEGFVAYHGERHRERITKKLNNVTILGVPGDLTNAIDLYEARERAKIKAESKTDGIDVPSTRLEDSKLSSLLEIIEKRIKETKKSPEEMALDEKIERIKKAIAPSLEELGKIDEWYEETQDTMIKSYLEAHTKTKPSRGYNRNLTTFKFLLRCKRNEEYDDYMFEYYRHDCIKLFKSLGFDYGDDYIAYLNDPKLREIVFNEELRERLRQVDVELTRKHFNSAIFSDIKKTIESLDIKGGNIDTLAQLLAFNFGGGRFFAAVMPYVTSSNEERTLLLVPTALECSSQSYIHELNHVIETDILNVSDSGVVVKCGFETIKSRFTNINLTNDNLEILTENPRITETVTEERPYEKISEVSNDYFACDVLKTFERLGIVVNPLFNEIRSTTCYSDAFTLLGGILEDNKKSIHDCILSADPNKFREQIGTNVFNSMAKDIALFLDEYDSYKIEQIQASISRQANEPFNFRHIAEYKKLNLEEQEERYINYHLQFMINRNFIKKGRAPQESGTDE